MIGNWRRAVLYGFLIWLVPFLVAFAAFPLKTSWRSLFESIMPVTVAAIVVMCAIRYFRRHPPRSMRDGIVLGLLWMAISIVIDLPLMLSPPINYTLPEYAADVGLTYLMMPIIVAGMAHMACSAKIP
jgi:hypothetical protein